MSKRINTVSAIPAAYTALLGLSEAMQKAAADAGLDQLLVELVKIRASQINGCAFCLDMHTRDSLEHGEQQRRLNVLAAWRETNLFTEQERLALEITEELTRLAQTRELPDELYRRATAVFTEQQYAAEPGGAAEPAGPSVARAGSGAAGAGWARPARPSGTRNVRYPRSGGSPYPAPVAQSSPGEETDLVRGRGVQQRHHEQ
jgi:AhpD family alkylhydroperoxidase